MLKFIPVIGGLWTPDSKKDVVGIGPKDDPSWLQVALLPFSSETRLEDFCVAQRSQVVSVSRNLWGTSLLLGLHQTRGGKDRRAVKMAGSVGKGVKMRFSNLHSGFWWT